MGKFQVTVARDRGIPWFSGAAFLLFLFAVSLVLVVLLDPNKSWVQSDYAINLVRSMENGVSIQPLSDILNTIATSASLDQRARFLSYFLLALDQKLRLALNELFPVLPSLNPILWLLHGLMGPVLLFRFVAMTTESKAAAWVAAAIYISSPGFLYAFTMNWLPQKALINLGFIAVMYLAARIDKEIAPGALLFSGSGGMRRALLVTLLALFLTDEYGFFAPTLIVSLFWWRFFGSGSAVPRNPDVIKNLSVLALPIVAFLVLVLGIVPQLSRKMFGLPFKYHTALGGRVHQIAALDGGDWLAQVASAPVLNLVNLLGISMVPYDLVGISELFPQHFGVQVLGLAGVIAIAAFVFVLAASAREARRELPDAMSRHLLPVVACYFLLIGFISVLALSHEPRIINGFYYGAPIAVVFAILMGYTVRYANRSVRVLAIILASWITLVQFLNFDRLNAIWSTGSDSYIAQFYGPYLPFRAPADGWSMHDIRGFASAAREGRVDAYLDTRALPPRLFYMMAEQCVKDPSISRRCYPLLEMLRRVRGSL